MMSRFLLPIFLAALALATSAQADTGIRTGSTSLGKVLTDGQGMTLYVFDKDDGGASACYDSCAQAWPPLIAPADAVAEGDFGLITRQDGSLQWTFKGMPLYLWVKDAKPGDVTGDGVKGVWHAAMAE
jgi:predicted lipoprotein with Yx(FWY)xxD motif